MRPGLQSKLIRSFLSLLFLFLLIQTCFVYLLKCSFLLSSMLGVVFVIPLFFLVSRRFIKPILDLTRRTMELASGHQGVETHVYPDDELGDLSKAIVEMSLQLRDQIGEVSREKEYQQAILGGMAEGVLLVDGRGRVLLVNEALQRLLSISSRVTGKTTLEIIRSAELEEAIQDALHEGVNRTFEITLPPSGEKTFQVNIAGIPSSSNEPNPEMKGVIAVFHDITRLKDLERVRQDFAANVSHELRTPLTTIKGYAETLLEGALKDEVAFQFVQVIKRHADRLAQIVEDLLTLSKIESKGFQLKMETIPVYELIGDCIDFLKESAQKKMISISRNEVLPSLAVYGDRHFLEQVLINLLDNAVKYTSEDGKVEILVTEKENKEILFLIKDDGIGIPKEELHRIFERFYRVDKGRSKDLGGTGLGLSIVKHIIQAHHGRIWAESQPGKGSSFYFTLPHDADAQEKGFKDHQNNP